MKMPTQTPTKAPPEAPPEAEQETPQKTLWTTKEVAEMGGVAPITIHRRAELGEIGYFMIGVQKRFNRRHLEKYFGKEEFAERLGEDQTS